MPSSRFFIITGATGSGKTALINQLKKRGYPCVEEVARAIIKEEMKANGPGLPWKDLALFKERMLERFIATYAQAMEKSGEITFFDRDVLDLVAYDRLTHSPSSAKLQKTVKTLTYNNKVFVIPPWKEIYQGDLERKQTYEEALQGYDNLIQVYIEYGRELIEVPQTSVEERANFVESHVKSWL
jgi:predicted ATPase